jgi:hypothetical protein
MWEFPDIKQNRTLYAQANSNLPIRIQTIEQLIAIANNSAQLAAITIDSKQGARWRLTHPPRVDDVEIEPAELLRDVETDK